LELFLFYDVCFIAFISLILFVFIGSLLSCTSLTFWLLFLNKLELS